MQTPALQQLSDALLTRSRIQSWLGCASADAEIPSVVTLPGLTPYDWAWSEMKRRQAAVVAGDDSEQALLVVEHTPTITRGRGLQLRQSGATAPGEPRERQKPLAVEHLPAQVTYREVERGGDLTAHEPGQLVIYPVVRLKDRDLGQFLRGFEGLVIEFLNQLPDRDFEARSVPDASGVWVEGPRWSKARKIASLGVSVRSWVTLHGLALNVCNSLETFRWIDPCGYGAEAMVTLDEVAPRWAVN